MYTSTLYTGFLSHREAVRYHRNQKTTTGPRETKHMFVHICPDSGKAMVGVYRAFVTLS
jgi:hypothetical protein